MSGARHPLVRDLEVIKDALKSLSFVGLGIRKFEVERDPNSDALIVSFRLLAPESVRCESETCFPPTSSEEDSP